MSKNEAVELRDKLWNAAPTVMRSALPVKLVESVREQWVREIFLAFEKIKTERAAEIHAQYKNRTPQGLGSQVYSIELRDIIAAQVLQGRYAAGFPGDADFFHETYELRAEWAYEQADAMLKAREKK